ncbi:MAG: O-antigen polymerase [Herminiimonas sp.]|nr:O-antigen polymerase [Herminiimonas sp.]
MNDEKRTVKMMSKVMGWLFFSYPVSLALNKTLNDLVLTLIFLFACVVVIHERHRLLERIKEVNYWWIGALAFPLIIVLIQHFFLNDPLPARNFEDFSRFFLCIPIYLSLIILRPDIRPFLWGCFIFAIYSPLLMLWHMYILGASRADAPNGFLEIIPHTSLTIILSFLAAQLWIRAKTLKKKLAYAALTICIGFPVPVITQTRTGLLLILFLCVFLFCLLPHKNPRKLFYWGSAAILVMSIFLSNTILLSRTDQALNEINDFVTDVHFDNSSTRIRLELWRLGWKMFVDHPLIGVGNHRYAQFLIQYESEGITPKTLGIYYHPHDDFLRFAAEEGLLGIISFFLIYFVPLAYAMRAYRKKPSAEHPALLLLVFGAGFLVAGSTDVMLAWKFTISFYVLVASLLFVNIEKQKNN